MRQSSLVIKGFYFTLKRPFLALDHGKSQAGTVQEKMTRLILPAQITNFAQGNGCETLCCFFLKFRSLEWN